MPAPQEPADRPVRTVSLRTRVVVAVVALLAVLLVVLGLVVTTLLGDALRADLRTRLDDRAGYAAFLQEQGVTGQSLADNLSGSGVSSTFVAGGQEYIGRGTGPSDAGPPSPPAPGRGPALPQPGVEPTVTVTEQDGSLTATVELTDGTLTLQASENEIDRTLSVLRTIEIVAGAIALVLAALLLVRVVGVALRPLERMTSLAQRIGAGARGRRLRPTHPDTDLGRTAQAFDEMLDALETAELAARQAEERMRRFLADASHDLRTPLAGVIAGSDSLLRADPELLGRAEREERLVLIVRQARRASRLVDDLLVMTRLDTAATPAAAQIVDLGDLADQEARAVALRRPDVEVAVRDETVADGGAARVRVVPDDLRRAVANLLDNAVKVSPPGGRVDIRVTRDGADPGRVALLVADQGPGVPDTERERIFDRFVRLSESRAGQGSGLGLPIARAIARASGGDVHCGSRPDGAPGALFTLELPTDRAVPGPSAAVRFAAQR
ncbi:HAMP domain-containing histidine kinase [Nakamurella flavida]|uniref:histidine kinase n=1 Tax=Nakamurella flavida TaxID=363630 RepID=A0A939C1G3_9ACTN|nr:HAMP domain-containing sensor histidine kinase [Nakamurella flavida]MBM9475440.1 HAMP domain-containing histidine kinase [Nakamurella flavida]MDP9777053.1 signal transduction histidine kinase [Nakamurella flavida]